MRARDGEDGELVRGPRVGGARTRFVFDGRGGCDAFDRRDRGDVRGGRRVDQVAVAVRGRRAGNRTPVGCVRGMDEADRHEEEDGEDDDCSHQEAAEIAAYGHG